MEEYNDTYLETQKERTKTAQSARAERTMNGLRTDMIPTKKEYDQKCGDVVTYNYGRPMKWKEFKTWDTIHRREYLEHLGSKYGASIRDLAAMFDIYHTAVQREFDFLRIKSKAKQYKTESQKVLWQEFLSKANPIEEPTDAQVTDERKGEMQVDTKPNEENKLNLEVRIAKGSVTAEGDAADVFPKVFTFLDGKVTGNTRITVSWELV